MSFKKGEALHGNYIFSITLQQFMENRLQYENVASEKAFLEIMIGLVDCTITQLTKTHNIIPPRPSRIRLCFDKCLRISVTTEFVLSWVRRNPSSVLAWIHWIMRDMLTLGKSNSGFYSTVLKVHPHFKYARYYIKLCLMPTFSNGLGYYTQSADSVFSTLKTIKKNLLHLYNGILQKNTVCNLRDFIPFDKYSLKSTEHFIVFMVTMKVPLALIRKLIVIHQICNLSRWLDSWISVKTNVMTFNHFCHNKYRIILDDIVVTLRNKKRANLLLGELMKWDRQEIGDKRDVIQNLIVDLSNNRILDIPRHSFMDVTFTFKPLQREQIQ